MRGINFQKHKFTCGHIAIANCLKFLGKKCSYKRAIALLEKVKYKNKNDGSWPYQLATCLDRLEIKYQIILNNNFNKLKKSLEKGPVIWLFSHGTIADIKAHWVFVESYKHNKFKIWNLNKINSTNLYYPYEVKQHIKHTRSNIPEHYDFCFLILRD